MKNIDPLSDARTRGAAMMNNLDVSGVLLEVTTLLGGAEALDALRANDVSDPMIARFFLAANNRLNGDRPLDLLRRGYTAAVLDAARAYGTQGGA